MRAKLATFLSGLTLVAAMTRAEAQPVNPPSNDGSHPSALALVILYDGSGSMANKVPNVRGEMTPKYVLANHAIISITRKLEEYCTNKNVTVDAGLVYFKDAVVKTGIPFHRFEPKAFRDWAGAFRSPTGGTPLGEGIKEATRMLAKTSAIKKHILIVTDGESNQGEAPEAVVRRMKGQQDPTSVYFVAFDVSARVFNPVKQLGATVVSAANELELNTQIEALLGKKILLEAE